MPNKELIKGLEELKWFLALFDLEKEKGKRSSMVHNSFRGTRNRFAKYLRGEWGKVAYSKRCCICKKDVDYNPKKDKYNVEKGCYFLPFNKRIDIKKYLKLIKDKDLRSKVEELGKEFLEMGVCYSCLNKLPKELSKEYELFEDFYPPKQGGAVFRFIDKLIKNGILFDSSNKDDNVPHYRINAVKLRRFWDRSKLLKHLEIAVQQKQLLERKIDSIKKEGLGKLDGCFAVEALAMDILRDLHKENKTTH